jgi:hypothetical protein
MLPLVAFPNIRSSFYLVTASAHESVELPAGDGVSGDRERVCDRYPVLAFIALPLRLIVWVL